MGGRRAGASSTSGCRRLFCRYGGFFKLDVGGLMPLVVEVLGIHVHVLRRYGVLPDEEVGSAVAKLKAAAPHLAEFLREAASLQ